MGHGTWRAVRATAAIALSASLAAAFAPAALAGDDDWTIEWSNGFKLESPDNAFKLKFGGRIQADWTFTDVDPEVLAVLGGEDDSGLATVFVPAGINDGNEFRRARLYFSGVIYDRVEFKAQYDFAGGDAEFKDVYIGVLDTPVGNIRAGHFKEPFSIEELTSSKYITFLERSLPNALAPGRNTGIMFHDSRGDRFTWAVGAFRDADGFGETSDAEGKIAYTGRITGLPIYEDGGKKLLHVGFGYSDRDMGVDRFRFRARPEAHQVPVRFVDTGSFSADGVRLYNLEVAGVFDRFWFSAEHISADVDAVSIMDPTLSGGTYQAGYFLTDGDRRRYKTKSATFDRNKPARNFGKGGPGAWEIALRLSDLDLADEGLSGGEIENVSVALNWYLNPATRVMFDYVMSELDRVEDFPATVGTVVADGGEADFFLLRFQVDF